MQQIARCPLTRCLVVISLTALVLVSGVKPAQDDDSAGSTDTASASGTAPAATRAEPQETRFAHALAAATETMGHQPLAQLRQLLFCKDAHMPPGNHTRLVDVNGLQMYIYAGDSMISAALSTKKTWERHNVIQILWALKEPLPTSSDTPDDGEIPLFVDVGGNVGWFTLSMAHRGYRVMTFEAMKTNQLIIRSSLCLHPEFMSRVTLYAYGLGSKRDTCYIFSADSNQSDGITMCGPANVSAAKERIQNPGYHLRSSMTIVRLDEIIKEDIKVMKMDVEGFEGLVLDGAEGIFQEHKIWYIVLEFNNIMLRTILARVGKQPLYIIRSLQRVGYLISQKSFKGPWMNSTSLEAMATAQSGFCDLYCTHPEAAKFSGTFVAEE